MITSDSLKWVFTILFLAGILLGNIYANNQDIQGRVYYSSLLTVFLTGVYIWNWRSLPKENKVAVFFLLLGISALTIAILIDTYVVHFFEFSSIHLPLALTPALLYIGWVAYKKEKAK